ncbi:Guanine nucleotide regulatory protein [Entamoeba marina]
MSISLNFNASKFVPKNKIKQEKIIENQDVKQTSPGITEEELKQEVEEVENEENEITRDNVNIIFIGHVDCGKSTTSGNILYQMGAIDKRIIEKYEKEAKEKQRDSWWLAYIMDQIEEEKNKGITIDVARALFETNKKRYTILDAPGHRSFVPNMISAAAQADIAVLIVSARTNEFETGFKKGGQTCEHSQLCKIAGVKTIIIGVNKMDEKTVMWNKQRYDEIVNGITPFLIKTGFKENEIYSLPLSGLTGLNLVNRISKEDCDWYDGPSLIELLDTLKPYMGDPNAPIRLPIIDKFKDGKGNSVVLGKVESGTIKNGSKMVVMPNKIDFICTEISYDIESITTSIARPGDNVRIQTKGDIADLIHTGYVLCSNNNTVQFSNLFQAQVVVLDLPKKLLTPAYEAVIHIHTAQEEIIVTKITDQLDRNTGRICQKNPKYLKPGSVGNIVIRTAKPICMETFKKFPQLGRFILRDEGVTIAFGKILRIKTNK